VKGISPPREDVMKTSTKTEQRALSFMAAACYLISVALCGLAAYTFAQLTGAAAADTMHRLYHPLGMF
jgi:hypothetical protein